MNITEEGKMAEDLKNELKARDHDVMAETQEMVMLVMAVNYHTCICQTQGRSG
jgi:hypothetical protein